MKLQLNPMHNPCTTQQIIHIHKVSTTTGSPTAKIKPSQCPHQMTNGTSVSVVVLLHIKMLLVHKWWNIKLIKLMTLKNNYNYLIKREWSNWKIHILMNTMEQEDSLICDLSFCCIFFLCWDFSLILYRMWRNFYKRGI
jgi:hypothetical protein